MAASSRSSNSISPSNLGCDFVGGKIDERLGKRFWNAAAEDSIAAIAVSIGRKECIFTAMVHGFENEMRWYGVWCVLHYFASLYLYVMTRHVNLLPPRTCALHLT